MEMKKYQTLKQDELKNISGGGAYEFGYIIGSIIRTKSINPAHWIR